MARETEALLRSILYNLKTAESLQSAIRSVEVMCTRDEIAAVEKAVAEEMAEKNKRNEK